MNNCDTNYRRNNLLNNKGDDILKKNICIYHNIDYIYRMIYKKTIFNISILNIDLVISDNGMIHILNKKGIAKLSIPEKIKSEIINELNMINVTKQHNYYFQKG